MFGQRFKWHKAKGYIDLNYDPVKFVIQYGKPYHILRMSRFIPKLNVDIDSLKHDLINLQNKDGGWPWHWKEGKPSGMSETGRTMELLVQLGEDKSNPAIQKAFEFLLTHQRLDGGWSENKELQLIIPRKWYWVSTKSSTVWITASILRGLITAGLTNNVLVIKGIDFLKKSQNEDGGWPSHVGPDYPFGSDLASMDDVICALMLSGLDRKSDIITKLEKCTLGLRNQWRILNFAGSVLAILNSLNYSNKTESVRDIIQILIDSQKIDGGWSGQRLSPSDPWYTTYCYEQLVKYGIKYN